MTTPARMHHAVLRSLVDRGAAPSVAELARSFGVEATVVAQALERLASLHGVVLHPNTRQVWIAHPFATTPTPFSVRRAGRHWWGNCAWCSLGVAALLVHDEPDGADVRITTTLGGEDEQVTLTVEDGVLLDLDYVVHFPVPMRRAWDNVVYTCSVMQLFRSGSDVDAWCARHAIPNGDVRRIEVVWPFAREWYGRHLDEDWRKWTTAEVRAMFARHGLDGDIWELAADSERF